MSVIQYTAQELGNLAAFVSSDAREIDNTCQTLADYSISNTKASHVTGDIEAKAVTFDEIQRYARRRDRVEANRTLHGLIYNAWEAEGTDQAMSRDVLLWIAQATATMHRDTIRILGKGE